MIGALAALTKAVELAEWLVTRVARVFQSDESVVGAATFPRRLQSDGSTCGSRSVQAIATYFGRDVSHDEVKAGVGTTDDGTAATPIVRYMRQLGLRAGYHRRMSLEQLVRALDRGGVVLVDISGIHWAVLYRVRVCGVGAVGDAEGRVWLADPSLGSQFRRRVSMARFMSRWTGLGVIVSEGDSRARGRSSRRR